jgi:hypothetical protein
MGTTRRSSFFTTIEKRLEAIAAQAEEAEIRKFRKSGIYWLEESNKNVKRLAIALRFALPAIEVLPHKERRLFMRLVATTIGAKQ